MRVQDGGDWEPWRSGGQPLGPSNRAQAPLLPSHLSLPSLRMAEVVLGSQEPHVLWWGVVRSCLCTCTELRAAEMHEA